jgi:ABC-type polysaccharide/polyol phosphate transport system ATPase subunit
MKLFNHRICQNIASYASYFRLGFSLAYTAVERKFEILALANFLEALVTHFRQRALDRLSLGIQDALLKRNVHVGFHGGRNIILQKWLKPAKSA